MPSWIQCPKTNKLIPRDEYDRHINSSAYIQGDIEAFTSPIDGSVISDRSHLREHNRRHGVTDPRDYGDGYFERKAKEREASLSGKTKEARQARIAEIQRAIAIHEART